MENTAAWRICILIVYVATVAKEVETTMVGQFGTAANTVDAKRTAEQFRQQEARRHRRGRQGRSSTLTIYFGKEARSAAQRIIDQCEDDEDKHNERREYDDEKDKGAIKCALETLQA